MPVESLIQSERSIVRTALTGTVTISELLEFCGRIAADPQFKPHFSHLVEVAEGATRNLAYDTLAAVRSVDPFSASSRRAIVVACDVDYGISRMYASLCEGEDVQIFRSMDDAITYLGLPNAKP